MIHRRNYQAAVLRDLWMMNYHVLSHSISCVSCCEIARRVQLIHVGLQQYVTLIHQNVAFCGNENQSDESNYCKLWWLMIYDTPERFQLGVGCLCFEVR